jgi:3-phenylpropionate/trans-cinnamate dioxygenase ferredoxin subunit
MDGAPVLSHADTDLTLFVDVGAIDDFQVGRLRQVDLAGKDIIVVRRSVDHFYAVTSRCPHQGAPLCLGEVDGTFLPSRPGEFTFGMEGRIIRCPYHGYEYDLETGLPAFSEGVNERLVSYETVTRDGRVLVSRKSRRAAAG